MSPRRAAVIAAILAPGVSTHSAAADDWPWWRGPNYDGVSRETDWQSEGQAEPLWRANVGLGHSTCSIAAGRLYTLGFDDAKGVDVVHCLDARSGAPIWTFTYPAQLMAEFHSGGTLTTPTVDGDRVYITTRIGKLRSLDAATGQLIWQRNLAADYQTQPTAYGFGGSPLVMGELVICGVSKAVALNKVSGAPVWQTIDLAAMYATPQPFDLARRPCIAMFTREGLFVLDRGSGEQVQSYPWRKGDVTVNASTPVIVDDHRVFISSGYNHGAALIDFAGGAAEAVWENRVMRTRLSGCVLVGNLLFGFDESVLKCLDLQGNEQWRKRGLGMGALMAAGGRLIVLSERGELVIVNAAASKYEELSRVAVLEGGVCWASPVLSGGLIYCRNSRGDLVCLDHRPR